ncbi:hypothetical protein ACFQ2B_26390 [Streptomyces stramineus]
MTNYLPQYTQFAQGSSPTASSMILLPLMFGMLAAQLTCGHLISRNGRYRAYPIIGGALTVAGVLLLLLLDADTPTALAGALTVPVGIGIGLLTQCAVLITTNSAPCVTWAPPAGPSP